MPLKSLEYMNCIRQLYRAQKKEFLENGPAVFGKDTTLAAYEKKIKEMARLPGRKEVEIALLQNFTDGSS